MAEEAAQCRAQSGCNRHRPSGTARLAGTSDLARAPPAAEAEPRLELQLEGVVLRGSDAYGHSPMLPYVRMLVQLIERVVAPVTQPAHPPAAASFETTQHRRKRGGAITFCIFSINILRRRL